MNLKEQRAAALQAAQKMVEDAKSDGRELTEDEQTEVEAKFAEIDALDTKIENAKKSSDIMARLQSAAPAGDDEDQGRQKSDDVVGDSVAARFVKSPAFREFRKAHPSGIGGGTPVRIEAKDLGGLEDIVRTKATITTDTGQPITQRTPGYTSALDPDAGLGFLDLITTGTTDATYVEYAQVSAETDNAAIVPEGELKPLSDVTTVKADAKAHTYADGFDVTNQTLADDGALVAFLESRIRYHVQNVVIDKLINGTGGATEPTGILNTTGVQSQAFDTDVLTTIARALEKVDAAGADPQAIVLNPADAWGLRLLKNGNGDFYAGGPFSAAPFTPWGVSVVTSRRVVRGQALIGNFKSVQFLQREALSVVAFNQHRDYAQRNMAYVRAELRGLQLFYAPREVVVTSLAAGGGE